MRLIATVFMLAVLALIHCQYANPSYTESFVEPDTWIGDCRRAAIVVIGNVTNIRLEDRASDYAEVAFEIEATFKTHDAIKNFRKIGIRWRLYEPKAKAHSKLLLFCAVIGGKISLDRYVLLDDAREAQAYLAGTLKFKDQPAAKRLVYCARFLHSKDSSVSRDAHREFAVSDYKDQREAARKLDPKMLVNALEDPDTPSWYLDRYARLLGDCGNAAQYGNYLRKRILKGDREGHGREGMLEGYIMLQPKEGWRFLEKDIIGNPKSDFRMCYSVVKTMRFLSSQRPDLVEKKDLVRAMLALADFPDVADFAIDDLRKWRRWETTDQVLVLAARKSHDVGLIKRAVLRFALQSPAPHAASYVATQRKRDPDEVGDNEETLKLEPEMGPGNPIK